MAPPKRIAEMPKSSNKRIKLTEPIPADLVEHIISFLPIQSLHRNRVVSKRYSDIAIRSRNLDFSTIFDVGHSQLKAVGIIDMVFNHHKGSEIHRFALCLDHVGIEDKIMSWINTCIGKNIQDFVLDFSKSTKLFMEVLIDFWAIETLQVIKLRRCRFELPDDSPKGLKLLRTLSLVATANDVTEELVDAIFRECVRLESLEIIACRMVGKLNINARNHKNFKSLVVSTMPDLRSINLDAPTLEYYKYEGNLIDDKISGFNELRDANLLINRKFNRFNKVVGNVQAYRGVYVLTTTNIFLEAFTQIYVGGGRMEKRCIHKFENLREFTIFFESPTVCTLYDIAEFLKDCPKLEKVLIDVKYFTFQPQMFWEIHHKHQIENNKYNWKLLREVEIIGYKGNQHELDIVQFFVKNAPSLEKLRLLKPRNAKKKARLPDDESINLIKRIFPGVEVKEEV